MILKGRALRLPRNDDINTDTIISGRYKYKIQDMRELSRHTLEILAPDFYERVGRGDFLVVGENFGCGSSREQAPWVLKETGLGAVIAGSFARIFYRNAFNIGLPLIEADTSGIGEGDRLLIDLKKGILKNITRKKETAIKPIPGFLSRILKDGGVVKHFKKHGGFRLGG
jgi:3-isopropylmalate/(R)-2-methylmalate dehydratase small subunit